MLKKTLLFLLLAAMPAISHAGQGTILETDSEIIIEYSGSDDEIKAGAIVKEKEEKATVAEDEKNRKLEDKHAAQRAKSEARRAKDHPEEGE